MAHASAPRPDSRRGAAAFNRRLSRRDVRELAHLTAALKAAGAPAFERYGVVVHLVHPLSVVEFERPVVAQAAQGVPPPVADGECVRPARELTPRQRRRRERGQQLAQQRKHRQLTGSSSSSSTKMSSSSSSSLTRSSSLSSRPTARRVAPPRQRLLRPSTCPRPQQRQHPPQQRIVSCMIA